MAGLPTKSDNALQQWHHLFESRGEQRSLQAQQHWQQLMREGLPTRKHENWKYTSLESLLGQHFVLPSAQSLSREQADALALPLDAVRLVFVDGRFQPALSSTETDLFEIQHVQAAERRDLPAPVQPEIFLHLTESLAEEVTTIRLARGKAATRPLYLLHITSGQADALNTVHHRHHVELEQSAVAEIVEHYVTLNDAAHFTGARITFAVADNAQLKHTKLAFETSSSYHFAHNDIVMGQDARVSSTSFLLGAGLSRHNTSTQLNGENSELAMNSLVLPVGSEIADTRSYLEHNKGHCLSRQLHKTISREKGRAVFNGHIKVAQHALKTDGQMTNNNLLLGRLAEVDTKPQLEIYADDVKCSHGATIGRIDDEQMFYLRSRGIAEEAAQQMIIHAFAAELTETLDDDILRQAVLARISQRFPGVHS
ncbi:MULTISPECIES: Fe-S cluster assembly protein SufD [Pantoea]|jgi:Fe-S cluster assembly protein SufD|uniref:Fe-S cluster assembly protein SufD n=1 Tax=Pantoea eucrina TaxID=472693 RepID=A0ABS1Z1J8_9GAMM|nr:MULTISPECIES: Fe-S cluster assembly protein SufD [Pantoea]AIX51015.1 cysteine desulfurase [Pantoea sp. PSNIH1]KAA5970828.1 Fe-S cluster assembly protein SufD [Pantoea sp. M_9]KAA6051323.1 Fe-S cluster assembly protein SufD [Pantoea sp. Bo_7]KAA6095675.1 Fe-S cluster assembly protein SufD [Pantoea sp. Bo_10]MBM0746276.1 Fe-S cluster assembly protein SufD [Pantoea eucrina]